MFKLFPMNFWLFIYENCGFVSKLKNHTKKIRLTLRGCDLNFVIFVFGKLFKCLYVFLLENIFLSLLKKKIKKILTDLKCNFDNEMTQFRLNITLGLEKKSSRFYWYLR